MTLVLFYGAFVLVDGVLALAHAIMGGNMGSRWWLALIGVAGIAAGILTFMWPALTALLLLIFIACWAIVLGVFQIAGAIKLRKEIDNEWTLILGGVLSVLFGIVLLVAPGAGAIGLIWVIAAYAVVFGVLLVMLAFRLKKHQAAYEDIQEMKFGLFGSAQARRGGSDIDSAQGFREFIDYNVEAEALGYASTFVVEHHFTGFGQVSASLNLLTWVAARTSTLRLGTAVLVLPWHNPVLLAEQAATIDLLSGGRLEFGVGKGYRHNEFASFCIPIAEADERFEESLALIVRSWTSDQRFSHHGKFWHFEDIVVEPPTRQKPHPPIWMAAGQPDSIRKVARRGAKLLLDQFASTALTIERFNIYRAEVEAMRAGVRSAWMSASRARSMWRRTPPTSARRSRRGSPTSGG